MKKVRKLTAVLICFAMLLGMLPFSAFAKDERPTDPALIADEDKYYDPSYDFERYMDLEGDDNGIHFEWNHETKTLFADGIKPESTLCRFYFSYYKFYMFNNEELAEEEAYGSTDVGCWDCISFETKYVEHIVIGKNISQIKNLFIDTKDMPNLTDIIAEEGHEGITVINSSNILSGEYEVDIPINNITLGSRAYAGKTYESVTLPASVTEIGKECFYEADIKLIDLSQTNITAIPDKCFYGVKNLQTVLLPPTVERIGQNAFSKSDIEYITLPSAVVYLDQGAFASCKKLESADLSRINVKNLVSTFTGCISLTEVYLPPMLEKMEYTFKGCASLTHIDIPDGVTEITGLDGMSLTSLDLPQGIKTLGIGDPGIEVLDLREYSGLKLTGSCYNNKTLKEVYFPREGFEAIEDNMFECCSNLEYVKIYSCTSIGHRAFAETKLSEVEIPDNCTEIDSNAFQDCHELTYVRMPMDLGKLTKRITGGITWDNPFTGCENLETVIYPSVAPFQYNSRSNEYSTVAKLLYDSGFLTNEKLTVYIYPDTDIERYCQDYGINYEYIDWELERNTDVPPPEEEEVRELTKEGTIGNGTFEVNDYGYSGYTSSRCLMIYANGRLSTTQMTCSNGVETDISELMQYYKIKNIVFREGTTAIEEGLFENYADLGSPLRMIVFSPYVQVVGDNAFRNCGVHQAIFNDNTTYLAGIQWEKMYIKDIGEYAFADNEYLTCVSIRKNKLTEIKEGSFYNTALCQNGKDSDYAKFTIPDGVTKIGKKAFGSFNRKSIWISDEPVGTDTELHMQQREMKISTGDGTAIRTTNIVTGPFSFVIPSSVTDIYCDPEHPEDNAIATKSNGYADEWIVLQVAKDSAAYNYAKMFGLRYKLTSGSETEEELNAPPTYDITDPSLLATPPITGIISTDELIANGTNSRMKWKYYPDTKTLTLNSTLGSTFSNRSLYYSDGTKVNKGDLEVDNLVLTGSFNQLYGKSKTYITPLSFFNPKHIDLTNVKMNIIFDEAFKDCTRLETLIISGENIYSLGNNLFENTPSLKKVVLGEGFKEIPAGMFENHKSLQFIELPETLETIGANAFKGCTALQKIDIPDSVYAIGANAFKSDVDVLSVTLGSGLNQIGKDAFTDLLYCEKVTVRTDKIRTDSSVIGIDYRDILGNLGAMTDGITVNFDNGLETADFKVFDDKKVTKIILGADIANLKNADCLKSLKEIELSSDNDNYYLAGGGLYTSGNILALVPGNIEEFVIANGCKGIGENAFYAAELETISIPGSVKTIGAHAFANAKNLKSVSLHKGTEEIGESAFENCDRLRFIFTPTNMASIGASAFRGCDKLTSIILNDELQSIDSMAFAECSALRGIVIPEHVETIGARAFADCKALEYAYIWDAFPIGGEVFQNDPLVRVYTVIGSNTYVWARAYNIPYVSYLDEDAFYTETMLRLDVEAGYLGYCEGEHGDMVWLTVCEADCEHEGYRIGVCEYCSELLEEEHIPAKGHSYSFVTHIPSTATEYGATVFKCRTCSDTYKIYDSEEPGQSVEPTQTVVGNIVFANNKTATSGTLGAKGVAVQLNGVTIARTDENGIFSAQLQSGTYNLVLHYAHGFDRTISITVGSTAVSCGTIPIIGCDFNKDGVIDSKDDELMRILLFAREGDALYVKYADFNSDGIIDSADYGCLTSCMDINAATYQYPEYII